MQTGRNEPCSCGSGKKTKQCCGSAERTSTKANRIGVALAVIAVLAAMGVIASMRSTSTPTEPPVAAAAPPSAPGLADSPAPGPTSPAATPAPKPGPQPPGPAPAGKVWSAEHGHWHEKPAPNPWVNVERQAVKPVALKPDGNPVIPQPSTPPPPGMVWSAEHGHWHDATTGKAVSQEIPGDVAAQMKKPGIPEDLKNYVWNEEHKHWHRKDGTGEHATATIAPPSATAPANDPR